MSYARGCFGAPSVFQHKSPACGRCSDRAGCVEQVRDNLPLVGERVDASDIAIEFRNGQIEAGGIEPVIPPASQSPIPDRAVPTRKVKYVLSAEQQAICNALPKKAGKVLDTLIRNGKLDAMLSQPKLGINPFRDGTPNWMEVTFDALLSGGFSKKSLKELLMSRLRWGETTAFPHVTKAVSILTAIGVIREEHGVFTLVD